MRPLFILVLNLLSLSVLAQFQVGTRTITYNDPARNNRAIECRIYYPGTTAGANVPVASGEFPIIVFGHGFTMQPTAYINWGDEFVPEGYIIVLPATETGFGPVHEQFGLDLRFIATQMQAEGQDNTSPFYQHVYNRTAIMGHSMGGGSSFLAASGFSGVDCIVGLAPAETGPSAVSAGANVSAPTLILSGASDGVTPPADHHIPIYNGVAANCKYFVSIANGSHCRFASNPGFCTLGELIPGSLSEADQQAVSYAVCRPWFEYFLKDDCDAWDDFQTALSTESDLGTINSVCANDAPVIADNNGTLESDQQPNYQWYLNGIEIPNETQQSFTYTQSGTYQVGTVNIGNCPVLSNEITVQITGVEAVKVTMSSRTTDHVLLTTNSDLGSLRLTWYDLRGKLLSEEKVQFNNGSVSVAKPTVKGIKLLQVVAEESTHVFKVW
ncbi:MAG: hypothetical protein H6603_00880 [Flavobacteriales bacterium]|nr:hypothetical protein [Flavobacteriales bacterium]